jgi:hypothetical protein
MSSNVRELALFHLAIDSKSQTHPFSRAPVMKWRVATHSAGRLSLAERCGDSAGVCRDYDLELKGSELSRFIVKVRRLSLRSFRLISGVLLEELSPWRSIMRVTTG